MLSVADRLINTLPEELRKNYYFNRVSLIIDIIEKINGRDIHKYDHIKNKISISNPNAPFYNELFYMAFRDKDKINSHPWKDSNFYYGNGISVIERKKDKDVVHGKNLNEGFSEYLSRKCTDKKNHSLNYYFADLLISIYGEEILNYPLKNDPEGLFGDKRFLNIFRICKELDELNNSEYTMISIARHRSEIDRVILANSEKREKITKLVNDTKNKFKNSLFQLFDLMIKEYKHCDAPAITNWDFISKLEEFVINPDYRLAFVFDDDGINAKIVIANIIENYKSETKTKLP